jgi:hypothetical protein
MPTLRHKCYEVPAEIIIEKPHRTNRYQWVWAICQPDACWGEYCSGTADTYEEAARIATNYLKKVHDKQLLLR